MPEPTAGAHRKAYVLAPGDGRSWPMGRLEAVFKADGEESAGRYSISEWWLEPHTAGPGAHTHPEDDVFYVLEGTFTFQVGEDRFEASRGAFVLAPGGVAHDFANRSGERAGFLNISVPGDFESNMPGISAWFRDRSEEDGRPDAG